MPLNAHDARILQMVAVFFQLSPAAAAVGDDEIQIQAAEDIHIFAGGRFQARQIAGQHVGRTAADLASGGNDPVTE